MKSQSIGHTLRIWLPAVLGLVTLVGASVYAMTRRSAVREGITELRQLSDGLTEAAAMSQSAVLSSAKSNDLQERRADLQRRIEEAHKPGLIQAELMATARQAALNVRLIQPVQAGAHARSEHGANSYPSYRVLVSGTYPQIAEYMQLCKTQRLPARVRGFRMKQEITEGGGTGSLLEADITLEVFQLPESAIKLVKG